MQRDDLVYIGHMLDTAYALADTLKKHASIRHWHNGTYVIFHQGIN